jgi:hypothetical protein
MRSGKVGYCEGAAANLISAGEILDRGYKVHLMDNVFSFSCFDSVL